MSTEVREPVEPGEAAPDFDLPAVNREGRITLADYRGKRPLLLGLYRGLHCPFCRRHLAQFALLQARLQPLGVDTVAVVNTEVERARLYFTYRPTPVAIAADPERTTHAAYRVPMPVPGPPTPMSQWPFRTSMEEMTSVRINPTGELAEPATPLESNDILNAREGFEPTEADTRIRARYPTQLVGHFLIDRQGVVRWSFLEARRAPDDIGKLPTHDEIVAAARALGG
jgi:peroxiredoxin